MTRRVAPVAAVAALLLTATTTVAAGPQSPTPAADAADRVWAVGCSNMGLCSAFYGNPAYTARNRADCVRFLRAFHTGQLPPGPG